jgi:O-6-methylguanine DNA methyltransferase
MNLFTENRDLAYWTPFATPLGTGYVASTRVGVCRISLPSETREHFFVWLHRHFQPGDIQPHPAPNMEPIEQIDAFLRGERTRFEFRLDLRGTDFQKATWQALLRIPYGQTTTYRDLAESVKMPRAYQAVGAAVGQNPLLVVVPCHRVLSADGSLTGYAAGTDTKRWLLRHEGALLL